MVMGASILILELVDVDATTTNNNHRLQRRSIISRVVLILVTYEIFPTNS